MCMLSDLTRQLLGGGRKSWNIITIIIIKLLMVPVGGGLVDGPCQLAMTIASPCEHMTHSTQAS